MLSSQTTIDAETHLYGIFGNPVGHSLSPLIHNTLFRHLKINAVYLAFQIEKDLLGLAFEAMRSLNVRGVNITVPFKETVLNFIDEIPEDLDRCIGAINTVVNKEGRLLGYNTDSPGFLQALREELKFNPDGKNILVLGAGGAARAVLFSLAHADADRIFIYNRTHERSQSLKEHLSGFFPDTEIEAIESFDVIRGEKIDLVVNATSCGLEVDDAAPFDLKLLEHKAAVYDLIYSPVETALLKQARSLGLPCANGLGMLANQAAISFGLWTGHTEGVREEMLEALKKCRF